MFKSVHFRGPEKLLVLKNYPSVAVSQFIIQFITLLIQQQQPIKIFMMFHCSMQSDNGLITHPEIIVKAGKWHPDYHIETQTQKSTLSCPSLKLNACIKHPVDIAHKY